MTSKVDIGRKYAQNCENGATRAHLSIRGTGAAGDLPQLMREIREAAADKTGVGAGFLAEIIMTAWAGAARRSSDLVTRTD